MQICVQKNILKKIYYIKNIKKNMAMKKITKLKLKLILFRKKFVQLLDW